MNSISEEKFNQEVYKLYKKINELNYTMARTEERLSGYYSLKSDVNWAISEIKSMQAQRQQSGKTIDTTREWILLLVSAFSSGIAFIALLLNFF